jgi:outer membrane murein-binding lipoprotein Lpp
MIQEDKQKVLNSEIRALTDQLKVSEEGQQLLNSEIQMLNNRENDTKNQLKLSKEKENWLEARISMLEKESEEAKHLIVQLDLCKDEQELLTQKILKFDKDENNLRIQLKKFEEDDKLLKYRIKELDDKNDELENKLEAYREYIKEARESFDRGMFLLKKGSAAEIEKFQKGNTIPYELGLDLVEKYIKNTHEIAPSMLYSVLKVVKSKNPKKIEKLAELLKEKELVSDNYRNARLNINLLRENAAFDVPSYYLPISDEARNFIINFLSAQESNGTVGYLINSGKLLAATVAYLLLSGNNPGPGSIAKS